MNADGRSIVAKKSLEAEAFGGLGVIGDGAADVPVGSVPLEDSRAESYCQKIVSGIEQLEAFWQAYYDEEGLERSKKASALSRRSQIGSKTEVINRISWLNKTSEGASRITRAQKKNMLDDLLEKSFEKAMSDHASPKEVSVCLDVMARHDMMNGDISKPKVVIEFAGLDSILGEAAFKAIESRLGIKQAEGEVIEAETVKGLEVKEEKKENGEADREAESEVRSGSRKKRGKAE